MNKLEKRESILVVDDNPINIKVLAESLRDTYRVRVAGGGKKALDIAQSDNPPDIILLDIMMPEIDGYEVCRRLKQNPRTMEIPVIFVTAKGESDDKTFGLNLGAADYITKPVSSALVKARVRTHLQLKQRTKQLEAVTQTDGLTEMANRRKFESSLEQELVKTRRTNVPLGLLLIDIDEFEAFNDNYGHGVGDDCLRQLAGVIKSALRRPYDIVARYGGNRFAVIFPDCDPDASLKAAGTIINGVSALTIPHAFSKTADHLTVSVGCISITGNASITKEELLDKVEKALSRAKHEGRNRISAAQ